MKIVKEYDIFDVVYKVVDGKIQFILARDILISGTEGIKLQANIVVDTEDSCLFIFDTRAGISSNCVCLFDLIPNNMVQRIEVRILPVGDLQIRIAAGTVVAEGRCFKLDTEEISFSKKKEK